MKDNWTGCYPSKWKGIIVDDAMRHPAKFSSRLIGRIYEHMVAEGWLKPGDVVIDPFGGVALGALDAMRMGIAWRGVELEAKFAELGNQNIASWNSRFSTMPQWNPDAVLLQGDSRNLLQVLGAEGHTGAISSPPYAESIGNAEQSGIDWGKQADRETDHPHGWNGAGYSQAAISSPPYSDSMERAGRIDPAKSEHSFGPNSQMANSDTRYSSVAGAISSPPYTDSEGRQSAGKFKDPEAFAQAREEGYRNGTIKGQTASKEAILRAMTKAEEEVYGATPGQLGAMKGNGFDAAISSPPFQKAPTGGALDPEKYPTLRGVLGENADSLNNFTDDQNNLSNMPEGDFDAAVSSPPFNKNQNNAIHGETKGFHSYDENEAKSRMKRDYILADTSENLGNRSDTDFWAAARTIVEQVYLALASGGDPMPDGENLDFCDCP